MCQLISCCCDDDCCQCKIPKCSEIPKKRFFLPLIGVFALTALPEFKDFVYLPIVVIFGFLIIFWNFPKLVYMTASKPLYYEDLFIDEKKLPNYNVDERIRKKFQFILECILVITNSLLTGALADYWLYKTTNKEGWMEILGITGGIIKIFQIINNTISRTMLKCLKRCIKKENKILRLKQITGVENIIQLKRAESSLWSEIEMSDLGIFAEKTSETKRDKNGKPLPPSPSRPRADTL